MAVTVTKPADVPVNIAVHVRVDPLLVQLVVPNPPVEPEKVKATVPPRVDGTTEVSLTMAVHVEGWFTVTVGGEHATAVVVECGLTMMLVVPWLVVWLAVAG